MEWTDITFLFTLFLCLSIASTYKALCCSELKKSYGAFIGFIVVFLISGEHVLHPMFVTVVNCIIILQGDKRLMHIRCFLFSWTYLVLLHLNVVTVSWQTIPIQMIITLRLVGLSFELNASYLSKNRNNINCENCFVNEKILQRISVYEELPKDPDIQEIIAYTFNFIGIHRGPYYKWKTFNDYFSLPFSNIEDINIRNHTRIKSLPICFVIFLWLKLFYPLRHLLPNLQSFDLGTFWYWYNIPHFVILLLHQSMISTLCETICVDAGFGIYPESCRAEPGTGPTQNIELLHQMAEQPELAFKETYNFGAIKSSDEIMITLQPSMRKTLRGYNMTVQYWFWACVYRRLPFGDKFVRTLISMFTWFLWSGLKLGNFITVVTILLYIYVEDTFEFLFSQTVLGFENAVYIGTCFVMKTVCFIYVTPSLFYSDSTKIFEFYNSAYWSLHIVLFTLLVFGLLLKRKIKQNETPTVMS